MGFLSRDSSLELGLGLTVVSVLGSCSILALGSIRVVVSDSRIPKLAQD